jgi:hypothetical protein
MAKPASSKSGDKSSKGPPPTRKSSKKAPLATSEELSEEESDEDKINKKKQKLQLKLPLKKRPSPQVAKRVKTMVIRQKRQRKISKLKRNLKTKKCWVQLLSFLILKTKSIHSFIFMELTGPLILGHVEY